jgi:hypothetical protein
MLYPYGKTLTCLRLLVLSMSFKSLDLVSSIATNVCCVMESVNLIALTCSMYLITSALSKLKVYAISAAVCALVFNGLINVKYFLVVY